MSTGSPANPAASTMSRRRSQRILIHVNVNVRGASGRSENFDEDTETQSINAHGALILLKASVIAGQKVILKHNKTNEEQECVVAHLGNARGARTEVGLEFSKPKPTFWRVAFPPEDWTPRHPDARGRT